MSTGGLVGIAIGVVMLILGIVSQSSAYLKRLLTLEEDSETSLGTLIPYSKESM